MSIQLQEQKRSKSALAFITSQKDNPSIDNNELLTWSSQFPTLVHTAGLGQACAFFKSRSNVAAARELYQHLNTWLAIEFENLFGPSHQAKDLLDVITMVNSQQYRLLQSETQAYLQWVKQLSKAYLK